MSTISLLNRTPLLTESKVNLEQQIASHSKNVQTQSYSMSVSEMLSMYRDGELELHPEFQRFFRWTPEQKSRLVESLILGIPVPPIFVSERTDAKWDVIDGLQRLSTILELMGELSDPDGNVFKPLTLTRTYYLPELEGKTWTDNADTAVLPDSVKIRLKRARLDVNIVRNSSDQDVKYEVFQRLNTGGAVATDQEVRNCLLVMSNLDYFKWLQSLSKRDNFRETLSLTDRALEEGFDMELVSRLLIFSRKTPEDLETLDELGSYLNRESVEQARDPNFPFDAIASSFDQTFNFLAENFGENSFRRYSLNRGRYLGPLLVSVFEVVAVGLCQLVQTGGQLPDANVFLERHKQLWPELGDKPFVGSGIRASTRVPETVRFGRNWVRR
jgi:hypothetical protein